LCRAIGLKIKKPNYFTGVAQTIETLPVSRKYRWLFGGLLHFLPVAITFAVLLSSRWTFIRLSTQEIVAILLASTWTFVGPILIWHYSRGTLRDFELGCSKSLKNRAQRQRLSFQIESYLFDDRISRYICAIWILLTIYGMFEARFFILDFGIYGYTDPFFWLIVLGTIIVAFYTSIGICSVYKAVAFTKLLSESDLKNQIYSEDHTLGLSFIGRFAYRTAWMFFTGWLFAPLIVIISLHRHPLNYAILVCLLLTYFVFTLLSFILPTYLIHKKIVLEKIRLAIPLSAKANELTHKLSLHWMANTSKQHEFVTRLLNDVQSLPSWPLNFDIVLKFVASSIIVPTTAAI